MAEIKIPGYLNALINGDQGPQGPAGTPATIKFTAGEGVTITENASSPDYDFSVVVDRPSVWTSLSASGSGLVISGVSGVTTPQYRSERAYTVSTVSKRLVRMQGSMGINTSAVSSTLSSFTLGQLPSGYRPAAIQKFPCSVVSLELGTESKIEASYISIDTDGYISVPLTSDKISNSPSHVYVSLAGIVFEANV